MALTKITGQVVDTTTDLVVGVTTVGGGVSAVDGFFSGIITATGPVSISTNLTVGGSLSVGGTITYEDVTNIDAVGIITARSNILVGSGITLSPDGDIFFTGIMTGNGSGLTGVANTDVIFTDKLSVGDSPELIAVGVGSDLRLFHDGNSYLRHDGTGDLYIQTNGSAEDIFIQSKDNLELRVNNQTDLAVQCTGNAGTALFHQGNQKLTTASGGVTVTGTVAATSYTGDGSALTGIEAGIQTSVPKSVSGITTVLDLSKDDFKITAAGITTIDVRGGSEGNSHTLRIHNSGITTVGFSTYFLFPSGAAPIIPTADGTISLISFTVDRQGAVGLATQLLAGSSVNFS